MPIPELFPTWRFGTNGTTYQSFEFKRIRIRGGSVQEFGATRWRSFPWLKKSPRGIPWQPVIKPQGLEYLRDYAGERGVFRLESQPNKKPQYLFLGIPNYNSGATKKVMVQLQYDQATAVGFEVTIEYIDALNVSRIIRPNNVPLAKGVNYKEQLPWKLKSFFFDLPECPKMETVKIAPLPGGVLYVSRVGVDTKCNKRFILGNNNQFFIWLRYLLVQWLALIDKILGRYDNVELKLPEDEEGNGEEMVDTGFDS